MTFGIPCAYPIILECHLGFDYDFDSLNKSNIEQDGLYKAFNQTINGKRNVLDLIQLSIPGLRSLVRFSGVTPYLVN